MLRVIRSSQTDEIKSRLLSRADSGKSEQQAVVDAIIEDVSKNGDEALFRYTKKFDNYDVNAGNVRVTPSDIGEAYEKIDAELIDVMREAAANIEEFHMRQRRENWYMERPDGSRLGQLYLPVDSAGVYVPGGKAAYPSSVLMNIIPAKCAGVPNIYAVSPAPGGVTNPATVVAADIAGANTIFKVGGAQAVAALAYGTASIPKVDKITGPGNIYVALAKKRLYGQVGIDMIAGPSEVLVIADKHATPAFVAADFLSQAEHDELAACILVTDDEIFAGKVAAEVEAQLSSLERREIIEASLNNYGTIIICENMDECVEISNSIAPEHLELCVEEPTKLLGNIKNAGSIFMGEYSPEPLGDYFAGANHVLPTNGTARFSSPLNVDDFQKKSSVIYYSKEAFSGVYKKVEAFANAEGLTAHARSAAIRFHGGNGDEKD